MPGPFSHACGLAASRVSMLTATTSKPGPPSFSCRAASAGISLRHGMHQVAHRLRRTTRPRQSASVLSAPAPSLKLSAGTRRASSATLMAATSPRASGAMRRAVSPPRRAGRGAAAPRGLQPGAPPRTPAIALEARNPVYRKADPRDQSRCNPWVFGVAPSGRRGCLLGTDRHDRTNPGRAKRGSSMSNKMWGGRFSGKPGAVMAQINASIDVDRKLYRQDIAASKAHARMLAKQGIISAQDAKKIVHGLDTILSEIESGKFRFRRALEDIHMNVEARLADMIGEAAGRLHTGRSRHHQVGTDFKLWVRDSIDELDAMLAAYQRALAEKALAQAAPPQRGFTP